MYRSDYEPSRLKSSVKAVKELINKRISEDGTSAFSIVQFSNKAKKVTEFTNFTNELYSALDSLTIGGNSALGDALGLAIKLVIAELRKIAAKIPKILVVSDGNYTTTAIDPLKMAKLAKSINIKIDTFRLGEASQVNVLKRLSDVSGGTYFYSNDSQTLVESALTLAGSNIKTPGVKEKNLIENPLFLKKIAANLLRVQDLTKDQEQRIKQLRGEADYKKCSICFQEKDPITGGTPLLTLRYCPNCTTPFHIHCLVGWADSQKSFKLKESGTVRCVHCFYLLKIPPEVTQAKKLRTLTRPSTIKLSDVKKREGYSVNVMEAIDFGEEALYRSCPICNLIFEEHQKVIQCGNSDCEVLYHKDCFQKLPNSQCKNCSVKLKLN